MEPDKYLQAVLAKQSLPDGCPEIRQLIEERGKVEQLLRKEYGDGPVIRYGGSKAKGTMIRESYDLDLTCYFEEEDESAGQTLEAIYGDVLSWLQTKYVVSSKTSALRLLDPKERLDFHIDVVPGRFVEGRDGDAFLYQAKGEEKRLKTNLGVHVKHIKQSGVIDEIRLMKLWDIRSGVSLKTFVLELLVVKLLQGSRKKALSDRLASLWEELRDHSGDLYVEDPANPNGNDLPGILNDGMKHTLASAAGQTLTAIDEGAWESVFGQVEEPSDEEKAAAIEVLASRRPAAPKLWCP